MRKNHAATKNNECLNRIREILARPKIVALQAINPETIRTYSEIGREISEEEQRRKIRRGYNRKALIFELSQQLVADYGRDFKPRNLSYIRSFYVAFQKSQTLLEKLS